VVVHGFIADRKHRCAQLPQHRLSDLDQGRRIISLGLPENAFLFLDTAPISQTAVVPAQGSQGADSLGICSSTASASSYVWVLRNIKMRSWNIGPLTFHENWGLEVRIGDRSK